MPGTVYLTAETLRLVEGMVEVRSLGKIPVRGVNEPAAAFEPTERPPGRRFQASTTRGLTPFVGRQAEIAALRSERSTSRPRAMARSSLPLASPASASPVCSTNSCTLPHWRLDHPGERLRFLWPQPYLPAGRLAQELLSDRAT